MLAERPVIGTDAWNSDCVVVSPDAVNCQPVNPFPGADAVGLMAPGSEVGTGVADGDHEVTEAGQTPLTMGATCTEPGVLEVVAQLT